MSTDYRWRVLTDNKLVRRNWYLNFGSFCFVGGFKKREGCKDVYVSI